MTNHLKVVELLLDLLSKERSQPVASCDFTPAIILAAGPGLMKLNARAKDKALGS